MGLGLGLGLGVGVGLGFGFGLGLRLGPGLGLGLRRLGACMQLRPAGHEVRVRVRVRVGLGLGLGLELGFGYVQLRPSGHEELPLQLAQSEARGEHVGTTRLAATQQPGGRLLRVGGRIRVRGRPAQDRGERLG